MTTAASAKSSRLRPIHIARELIAIAIWGWISLTTAILLVGAPRSIFESIGRGWVIDPRLLTVLTLGFLTAATWKVRTLRPHLLYVTFYPAVVLGLKVPKLLYKNWALTLAFLPAVYEAVITFRLTLLTYIGAGVSLAIIARSSDSVLITAGMAALAAALFAHLWQAFQHAYRATMFSSLTQLVRRFKLSVESGKIGETFFAKGVQTRSTATIANVPSTNPDDGSFEVLYLTNCLCDIAAKKVAEAGKSKRIDVYLLARWLWTLVVISVVFPFENWGAYKISPVSFAGIADGSFTEFLLYSLSFLPGSRAAAVDPRSTLAVSIYVIELFCYGFALLVLLPFTILMVARQNYQDDITDFANELSSTATCILDRAELAFRLTFDQIELAIAGKNAVMVNLLRQARGMPVLVGPPPAATPNSSAVSSDSVRNEAPRDAAGRKAKSNRKASKKKSRR